MFRPHRIVGHGALLAVFVLSLLILPSAWAGTGAQGNLEAAVNKALSILRDPAWSQSGKESARREKLRKIVYAEFDFNKMSALAVGREWRKFSPRQRDRFVDLFRRLLENKYMGTIERYKEGTVEFVKEVRAGKGVRVDSVVKVRGEKYSIAYRMHRARAGWKVYDVIIQGVSVNGNFRSQFKQELRHSTPAAIDALLDKLASKVDNGGA